MKVIKTDTFLKPLPKQNYVLKDRESRFVVTPITDNQGRPTGTKFIFKPRCYVFGVFSGSDSWFTIKYDTGNPINFDLPGEIILNPRVYSVFCGYSDGFLGGSFTPGYYSLKERVQYWYCVAQTKGDYSIEDYFLAGDPLKGPVIIDLSSYLTSPVSTKWKRYKIGDPIKLGQGIRFGDVYDE